MRCWQIGKRRRTQAAAGFGIQQPARVQHLPRRTLRGALFQQAVNDHPQTLLAQRIMVFEAQQLSLRIQSGHGIGQRTQFRIGLMGDQHLLFGIFAVIAKNAFDQKIA